MKYKKGYKYQLVKDESIATGVYPTRDICTQYIDLSTQGILTIRAGYAWDGPSGPTIDTKTFMRGSLVHDALYQLMRYGLLEGKWRDEADAELQEICLLDGMWIVRAWWVHKGVRIGGARSADPRSRKDILTAP